MSMAACALMFLDYDAGCAEAETVLRLGRAESRHGVVASMLMNLGSAAGELMHLESAARWLSEAIAFCAEHEIDGNVHYGSAWLALCDLRTGDWAAAADRAAWVVERSVTLSISRLMALVALGSLRLLRGDPEAQPVLDEALSLAGRSDTLQRIAPVRAMRAEAAWLRGDLAACDAEARAALGLAQQRGHPWFIGELAAWCWRAGTLHEAAGELRRAVRARDLRPLARGGRRLAAPRLPLRAGARAGRGRCRSAAGGARGLRHPRRAAGRRSLAPAPARGRGARRRPRRPGQHPQPSLRADQRRDAGAGAAGPRTCATPTSRRGCIARCAPCTTTSPRCWPSSKSAPGSRRCAGPSAKAGCRPRRRNLGIAAAQVRQACRRGATRGSAQCVPRQRCCCRLQRKSSPWLAT